MKFIEKLREVRKANHLTQKNIANQLGISERAYQHYEAGTREPNIETLLQLSIILNISLDELLCRHDYRKSHEVSVDEH